MWQSSSEDEDGEVEVSEVSEVSEEEEEESSSEGGVKARMRMMVLITHAGIVMSMGR